jgi:hypothetical protein
MICGLLGQIRDRRSLRHPNATAKYSKLQETVRFVHDVASRITGTVESASDAAR